MTIKVAIFIFKTQNFINLIVSWSWSQVDYIVQLVRYWYYSKCLACTHEFISITMVPLQHILQVPFVNSKGQVSFCCQLASVHCPLRFKIILIFFMTAQSSGTNLCRDGSLEEEIQITITCTNNVHPLWGVASMGFKGEM